MNQSPRIQNSREDHLGSTELPNYGHYNCNQAPVSARKLLKSLALVAATALFTGLAACSSAPTEPEPMKPVSQPAQQPQPQPVEIAERAPERYVVKKGDTLWDISTMFLKDPWLWPEIWYVNPQIQNPHLIYPGDVITIFWYDGQQHMRITREGEVYQSTLPTERLSPRVRTSPLKDAIPTIPIDAIRPFLGAPRLIDEDEYEDLPYILRSVDGRLMMGEADKIYIRNLQTSEGRYNIIRLGEEYEDPESGEDLGFQAIEIGNGIVTRTGDPAIMLITASNVEALVGDRIMPALDDDIRTNFVPHAPADQIEGQIIDVLKGGENIGQYMVVAINRGARDGLEPGHVLDIYQRGLEVDDPNAFFDVQLPDQQAGTMMIFKVEDKVSYALVMEAFNEIHLLDIVRNP